MNATDNPARALLADAISHISGGESLSVEQGRTLFEGIMDGQWTDGAVGALLGALLVKGESVDELVGAAQAMRARVVPIRCEDPNAIDTCGTGGDGVSTFNVSTTAAIIAAAAGATVAKHGNRSSTRASGSTEALTELGVDVEAEPPAVERCLRELGIAYLNARRLHPAMKAVAPIRQAIPVRTIFNLLGPLTNPAGVRRQLIGVPRPELMQTIAEAMLRLGAIRAWVVHGDSGLCDVSITGATKVVEVCEGETRSFEVTPEEAGLASGELKQLIVDSPRQSRDAVLSILQGEAGARRDHALMNAGAALVIAGLAKGLSDGVQRAARAIDNGAAMKKLEQWKSFK